jgi:hypothetical protein
MIVYERVELELHIFLNVTLEAYEAVRFMPWSLISWEMSPQYPFNRRLCDF